MAVEVEPRYARGYANLGFAYLQMAKTEEAIEALTKAIELNPNFTDAWINKGLALGRMGHWVEAQRALNKGDTLENQQKKFGEFISISKGSRGNQVSPLIVKFLICFEALIVCVAESHVNLM